MARPAPGDWRRQGQERFLLGATLRREPYRAPRPEWDHDHCEFCGVKIMERAFNPDTITEGDRTTGGDSGGDMGPDQARWICPACFEDFAAEFGFRVE